MKMRCTWLGLRMLVGCGCVGVCASCADSRDDWYEKTTQGSDERSEKIDSLQGQGFDEISAAREADLQGSIKATERGQGVPPLEGADLKNAINQP